MYRIKKKSLWGPLLKFSLGPLKSQSRPCANQALLYKNVHDIYLVCKWYFHIIIFMRERSNEHMNTSPLFIVRKNFSISRMHFIFYYIKYSENTKIYFVFGFGCSSYLFRQRLFLVPFHLFLLFSSHST